MSPLTSLIALLQVTDSAFPAGTFAHSYGLEQAVRDGAARTARDVENFVGSLLALQASGADTVALCAAADAARSDQLDAMCSIDTHLFRTKPAAELREASVATGARLLREVAAHVEGQQGLVPAFLEAIDAGRTPGTQPVAFAVAGSAFEVGVADLAAASLFATANTLWSAALRLCPVSHRDAQGALHRHRGAIAELAIKAVSRGERWMADQPGSETYPFTAFHPLQEIASMRHEQATVRLFAS